MRLPVLVIVGLLASCGGSESESSSPSGEPVTASSVLRRDARPQAVSARRLIDEGRADLARPLVEQLAPELGVEGPLLRARLTFLERDETTWLGLVEEARAMDPTDPRPYATAAEIYAALGRMEAASEELRRGVESAGGLTPELQRTQGVLAIVHPSGGKIGLEALLAAERADPDLPYMGRPLGQAYLLAAKRAMAEGSEGAGDLALERIEKSLEYDPTDIDARHFYGQVLISKNEFTKGLGLLEELFAQGEPIRAELGSKHWSAGFYWQVRGDRASARRHYLRARELGYTAVEEGSARRFLGEEFDAAFERADTAARVGDDTALRAALAEMIGLRGGEPDNVRRDIANVMLSRAEVAHGEGDLEGATSLLGAAVQVDPRVPRAAEVKSGLYMAKAVAAIEEQEVDVAIAYAEEATVAQPDNALAWHLLGDLRYARGEYEAAADSLERAMLLADADEAPLGIEVALRLAESQHLSDRIAAAISTLEQCIRTAKPEDAELRAAAERHLRLLADR